MTIPAERGLQAERTALAWSRTSLAVLANGVLLILKHPGHNESPLRIAAAILAGILTVGMYLVGRKRQRMLARRPLPARITPEREVTFIAIAVIALIVIAALGLFV
jgi:uncharacterized membrane protein YidH (DUF202 family)